MVYHAKRGKMVLYGGQSGMLQHDTWQLASTTWTQQINVGDAGFRSQHRMAYDSARKKIVLFGGCTGGCDMLEDGVPLTVDDQTWTLDGSIWVNPGPVVHPEARCCQGMAYIGSTYKKVVLFGGVDQAGVWYADTWLWDGLTWCQFPC
jgi:hypothetical protein